MDDVVKAAARHRQALAAGQRTATRRLAAAYAQVWQSVSADWAALSRRIADARLLGEDINPEWLAREARYRGLILRLEQQIVDLAPLVGVVAGDVVDEAVTAAIADASELAALAAGGETAAAAVLNVRAAVAISGATTRGPVADLIAARAGEHAAAAAQVIQEGVIRGRSPYRTARALRRVTGGAFTNAVTVVRTEQMRAYREGARQSYIANPAVSRWQWLSRCSDRTCAYCWAQHGRTYAADRVFMTHPNCACTPIPIVDGGHVDTPGRELFAQRPADVQEAVLGPSGYLAYRNGELDITDLAWTGRHPVWGPVGGTRSLTEVLGADRVAELRRELRG